MIRFETPRGRIEIRELSSQDEYAAAERIQQKVWGADIFPHPKELLIPVQREGGLLAGAFDLSRQEMVGLVFSFPTSDSHAQHSQMLATLEEWRGAGIGSRLKWFQRDWCLQCGVERVRWTVDPLRAANAVLNISHLGATASLYTVDYYGKMLGIDGGVPTDRLLIEWELDSERVKSRLDRRPEDRSLRDGEFGLHLSHGKPAGVRLDLAAERVLIPIPRDFIRMCREDSALALEWRLKTREVFQAYFSRGYQVREFSMIDGPAYILDRKN